MSLCYLFNIHSTNIIEHLLCAILEKQQQDFIKTEVQKKVFFFPRIFLTSLENYYIFQRFGSSINNCSQMFQQMFFREKANYLHYDTHM